MDHIQQWPAATSASTTGTLTRTGPATTAGNTLFVDLVVRNSTPTIALTDSASNTWTLVASVVAGGAATVATYVCTDAAPITSVTATIRDSAGTLLTSAASLLLSEYGPVGTLVAATTNSIPDGGTPPPVSVAAGQLVRAVAGAPASNRTWTATETGVDLLERGSFAGGQIQLLTADGSAALAGPATAGWTLTSGSTIALGLILMAYAAPVGPEPEPEPLPPIAATGLTPVGVATLLEAVSDADLATYGRTGDAFAGAGVFVLPAIAPPTAPLVLRATLSTNSGVAVATCALSPTGSDWVTAEAAQAVTVDPTSVDFTFPVPSLAEWTTEDWSTMQARITFSPA